MAGIDKNSLLNILKKYKENLSNIGFSTPEQKWLDQLIGDDETWEKANALEIVEGLIRFNMELNNVFENCPDSIYITDEAGTTLRVNKSFEDTTGIRRQEIMGRNVMDLENEGLFKPSMYGIVSKEKRRIAFLQEGKMWTAVVAGVPVYDEAGELYRVVSNARDLNEIKEITSYVENVAKPVTKADEVIIAESIAMKSILNVAGNMAKVDSNVLITGESGVGKGVLARYIHNNSARKSGKIVEINCGAIPETLLESELFGYESGAFSGADKRGKPGLIEVADKGTLFLDEIAELPLMLQVKLLNFLQNRKIIRIGGTKEKEVDVRVIAATNKDLARLVAEKKFRDDLYYRLHVVPIHIPPLRERTEDIYPAAKYFAEKFKTKYNKKIVFTEEFFDSLLHYEWMGNVRELENYMERMVVMSGEDTSALIIRSADKQLEEESAMNHMTLTEKLEKYEGELVRKAYEKASNSYRLAEALGISQPSASRKINKYIKGK